MYRTLIGKTVRFLKQEDGPTAVEYAVVLAMIILVCFSAIASIGEPTKSSFAKEELVKAS